MKKIWVTLTIAVLILAALQISASAASSGPPLMDAWIESANPDSPSNDTATELENLWARAAQPSCVPDRISYLKWDLSDIPSGTNLGYAKLTIQANFVSGIWTNARLSLRKVANDSWNENVTWNTRPDQPIGYGDEIAQVSVSSAGQIVFFYDKTQSPSVGNAPALIDYLQEQADGDNIASFALTVVGDCGSLGNVTVRFDSREKASGSSPYLELAGPNAVSLSTFTTDTPAPTWPLYAGLAALVVIAAAGVAWSRRRATQR